MATARLTTVDLPDFGMPARAPGGPGVDRYAERGWPRSASAPTPRGFDRLVVYADREHSANLAFLTGFDPRFEEAMLVVGPAGDPLILVGNECYGMAGAAPLADAPRAVPGLQPAEPAARPVAAAARDPGGGGDRPRARGSACSAGRRTRTRRGIEIPAFIVDELRGARRARRLGRATRTGCSSTRPTGCGSSTTSTSWRCSSTRRARRPTASGGCSPACDRRA